MNSIEESAATKSVKEKSAPSDERNGNSCTTPGSISSSGSDDTPGDTRSLTEEELDECGADESKVQHQSRGMTEPEPLNSPSDGEGAIETNEQQQDSEDKPSEPESVNDGSTTLTRSPPKFYRSNAFQRESEGEDDTDGETNMDTDLSFNMPANTDNGTDINSVHPETMFRNDSECGVSGTSRQQLQQKGVRFSNVCIRDYYITIGDSPFCSHGVPICLDWDHSDDEIIPIDFFEASHKRRRTARRMLLNSFQRRDLLWRSGYPLEEIEKAIKENEREKFRRSLTLYFLPLFQVQEILYFGAEKCFKGKRDVQQEIMSAVKKQQSMEAEKTNSNSDVEIGGMSIVHSHESNQSDKPRRRLSFRSQGSRGAGGGIGENNEWSIRSTSQFSDTSHDRDDPYAASSNSRFREYSVRVDRGQHDKASEIILCNLQRPHMRAFHAAWFSFFTAFFMWFAVTPLLAEIKLTLNLSKSDVWLSSLCGTAGTIIMRILIGPACDKFGARLCMAFVLAASAVPCALTGLVETAQGLAIIRAFVGIAGSSFVACQYWTSQMFTREVAGTANALVAGWGNLGGGVTQLVMGSALFPLFELIFSNEDDDGHEDGTSSSELAWRTVFIVPTVVSLLTAYTIVYHADDSPKGDYRERVRQQEIMIVSPAASLCAACQNWNVWILLVQYACCFGVEVTMTNATALYFQDEFGQTTVSAAAIASVFGFMNLFARGLGGLGSDLCNAKLGMRGRMVFQTISLFLEGIAVVVFGYADTLAGSILALVFLSLMVQSAEGSTFGIVPYVDRRFTGSVVGWVGAGGNVGGACFSVLFMHYDYEKSFALMGLAASASAFLSCFMNCKN